MISVPLGSLTNPFIRDDKTWEIKTYRFWVRYSSDVPKVVWFQYICTREKFKNWLWLFNKDFFLEWNITSLHLPHHYPGHSTALLRSSVDKNAFAHSVRFLPFSKCFLGSVYSCASNEKTFKFFYLRKLWCLLPDWVISHKCSQQRIWGYNTIVSIHWSYFQGII